MDKLIRSLITSGYLRTPKVIEAFHKIDRRNFIPEPYKEEAYENIPLPIGYNQTISQPLTVAFMLELLDLDMGNVVLEIGSGSGWKTALICQIIGPTGFVHALEIIPELKEFGEENVKKCGFNNTAFYTKDGSKGLPEKAPFDRIITAASAKVMPEEWKQQLKAGGKIVAPVGGSIWFITKTAKGEFEEKEYPGFAFVPLVSE